MSPWSTSRAVPNPGSSPCPSRRPRTAPSTTGSGGASRPRSRTSRPAASAWKTATSSAPSVWSACSWSWRWPCSGPSRPACGTPSTAPRPTKKSPSPPAPQPPPQPDLALQARHPAASGLPATSRSAAAAVERMGELTGGKGAQQPALGEAEDEVDAGQPERGVAPGRAEIGGLVVVALGRQAEVAAPAVGGHGRRLGDVGGEEGVQARGRGVGQRGEPEPAEAAAAGLAAACLDRPADQGLAGGAPAALAGPRATDVGLVGLDAPGQGLAVGADHVLAELVQPGPGGLVAAQAQLPLELRGGDPALAGGHQVDRQEPLGQACLGLLEDGAGQERVLLAAGHALVDDLGPERVGVVMAAC